MLWMTLLAHAKSIISTYIKNTHSTLFYSMRVSICAPMSALGHKHLVSKSLLQDTLKFTLKLEKWYILALLGLFHTKKNYYYKFLYSCTHISDYGKYRRSTTWIHNTFSWPIWTGKANFWAMHTNLGFSLSVNTRRMAWEHEGSSTTWYLTVPRLQSSILSTHVKVYLYICRIIQVYKLCWSSGLTHSCHIAYQSCRSCSEAQDILGNWPNNSGFTNCSYPWALPTNIALHICCTIVVLFTWIIGLEFCRYQGVQKLSWTKEFLN